MVLIHALRHMRLYGAILVALASLGGAVMLHVPVNLLIHGITNNGSHDFWGNLLHDTTTHNVTDSTACPKFK